ncbi:MAG: FtsX-like permease family protein [Solirubrobacteraceae bacterium]
MGRLLLINRLVTGDIKRHRGQSVLLLVMILATTTALSLGLALRHVSENPFARTRAATKGPDVVAQLGYAPGSARPSPKQFAPLLHAKGVSATAGPFPVAPASLTTKGISVPVQAEGRDSDASAVDQPVVTSGHWLSAGGVVLERGLADALGLHVGDPVHLGNLSPTVSGIAVSTQQPFYPAATPGLVWVTRADAQRLASAAAQPLGYLLDIKLAAGVSENAFYATVDAFGAATRGEPSLVEPWQQIRTSDYRVIGLDRKVLLFGSTLLSLLALASIAVLVTGRMSEQTRRVGLLKAVGATPSLVALVLLAENLALALVAAILGIVAGDLLTPVLASPGHGLLGNPNAPTLTVPAIAIVIVVAATVAAASTLSPAIRGARTSTLGALHNPANPPRRRARVIAISAALPVPLLLGLRLIARRTRRTVLTAASLMVAVAMVVAALTVQHDLHVTAQRHVAGSFFVATADTATANHVLVIISVMMVILAAGSTTFTAWATVIDAQRSTALARALGATPQQITAGLTTAQLLPGLAAAFMGIPVGLLLYQLAGGNLSEAHPPLLSLLAVIPGTLIAIALLTVVPARVGAQRSIADVLRVG